MSDTTSEPRTCPECGAEASGNFCSGCGTRLTEASVCAACGGRLPSGALYCPECGQAIAAPATKTASARLPWVLSAVALAAFSIVIAFLVQRNSAERTGDMLITGGVPTGTAEGSAGSGAGMPSMQELAAMGPRGAADRLFERAMSEHEDQNLEAAGRFVQMGLQAYSRVPPDEMDADGRFHVGLLHLVAGDAAGARASARRILDDEPRHLLGLILLARVERFAGDAETAAELRAEVQRIVEEEGGIPDRREYEAHRPLIERELGTGEGG